MRRSSWRGAELRGVPINPTHAHWDQVGTAVNDPSGGQVTCNRWFPGEIKQVSTSGTREGRKKLGLGWIYVAHDDGTKNWLLATRPTFYNAEKPGAWRFEPADDDDDGDDDEDDGVRDDDLVDADDEDESDFEYDDDDGA